MLGVVVLRVLNLPHGYWLPFTMVVVLQPDYGSTRQRAGSGFLGPLAGSLFASLLMWLHPSLPVVMIAMSATIFIFGFLVKRNYGLAVFFVTLFVVLLTEANGPVTIAFTAEAAREHINGRGAGAAGGDVFLARLGKGTPPSRAGGRRSAPTVNTSFTGRPDTSGRP